MEVETFVEDRFDADRTEQTTANVLREMDNEIRMSETVGLKKLATQIERQKGFASRVELLHPLSDEAFGLWETYLPTCYRMNYHYDLEGDPELIPPRLPPDRPPSLFSLTDYQTDRIPTEVLEIMHRAVEDWEFDWLEIRTGPKDLCPTLFGGIGNRQYLLGRWLPSGEQFVPLHLIPDRVRLLRGQNLRNGVVTALGIVFVLFGIFGSGLLGIHFHSWVLAGSSLIVSGLIVGSCAHTNGQIERMIERLYR